MAFVTLGNGIITESLDCMNYVGQEIILSKCLFGMRRKKRVPCLKRKV